MKAIGIPMKAADGRPTAQMKVYEWRKANPSGKKLIAIKTLGWIQRRSESGGNKITYILCVKYIRYIKYLRYIDL